MHHSGAGAVGRADDDSAVVVIGSGAGGGSDTSSDSASENGSSDGGDGTGDGRVQAQEDDGSDTLDNGGGGAG